MNKTGLANQILHHLIIAVGVNPQMTALIPGPVQAERSDSGPGTVGCHSVHGTVRAVIQPGTIFNFPVGWLDVFSVNIEKSSENRKNQI